MDNFNENVSSSDDEEDTVIHRHHPRAVHRPVNHFQELSDNAFKKRYRLTKLGFLFLLGRIIDHLPYGRNYRITPVIQLLTTLRFLATGSLLQVVGDCAKISKTSVWTIVHRVCPLIAALKPEFIRFPSTREEIRETQAKMFRISGFPRVVACVDGKHVPIESYGGEHAELFRNRHGDFSINVQGVCNADLEFVAFEARWPGSTHDSTVFRSSEIYRDFQRGRFDDALILGDSAYPNLPYMMTPLLNPTTAADQLYNEAQIRTRNCIERCFGLWARRFRIVGKEGTRFHKVERTLAAIEASAVVHNIAIRSRRVRPRRLNMDAYNQIHDNVQFGNGNCVRQKLVNGYFRQLI